MYEKSVELLNRAVADELSAVHQYMYFHFHCDDQGYSLLSALFKRTAIAEMIHIEKIADRILFLKGDVIMEASEAVKPITDVQAMLEMACEMEKASIIDYNNWALECSAGADSMSRKIFEELVMDEETHYGNYDSELDNLERFGDKYLALQSIENSKANGMPPAGM